MEVYEVNIPKTYWTLLHWRNIKNEEPQEGSKCLVIHGKEILATRYMRGEFYPNNWDKITGIIYWSDWPKPPIDQINLREKSF